MMNRFILLLIFAGCNLFLNSCDKVSERREYEEIAIAPKAAMPFMGQEGQDPHDFMKNHPPIGQAENQEDFMKFHPPIEKNIESHQERSPADWQPKEQNGPLNWKIPQGWREASGSGMRLATFFNDDTANPIECSIVSLGGQAGNLEGNVRRWMGQIGLSLDSEGEFNNFLSKRQRLKSDGGLAIEIIDFTALQSEPSASSIVAAVVTTADATVFVKMTGTKSALQKNRESFTALCQSLKS